MHVHLYMYTYAYMHACISYRHTKYTSVSWVSARPDPNPNPPRLAPPTCRANLHPPPPATTPSDQDGHIKNVRCTCQRGALSISVAETPLTDSSCRHFLLHHFVFLKGRSRKHASRRASARNSSEKCFDIDMCKNMLDHCIRCKNQPDNTQQTKYSFCLTELMQEAFLHFL